MKSTKQLAQELGLVLKRSASSKESYLRRAQKICRLYDYLVVIDFESTCWDNAKTRSQEIIEFPAVLINTRNGNIEDEFHYFVQPQENPVLSDFCKKLTGISQKQVEDGIPLSFVLRKFDKWLNQIRENRNMVFHQVDDKTKKSCTFVTWSDWDLSVCLHYECRRKQIRKPGELNSWIDLRSTYRKFYKRKPNGLNGALQDVGMNFEGREHSGLDDARNTAKLAFRLMTDGCVLSITKSLDQTPRQIHQPISSNIGGNFYKSTETKVTETSALPSLDDQTKRTPSSHHEPGVSKRPADENNVNEENSAIRRPLQKVTKLGPSMSWNCHSRSKFQISSSNRPSTRSGQFMRPNLKRAHYSSVPQHKQIKSSLISNIGSNIVSKSIPDFPNE